MEIGNKYLRIFIGSVVPIIIFSVLSFIDAHYIHINKNFNIIFLLLYAYILMSIPLLLYSTIINKILDKKNCISCVLIISIITGVFLTLIPTFLDKGVSVTINHQYFYFNMILLIITAITSGYLLYKLYPNTLGDR